MPPIFIHRSNEFKRRSAMNGWDVLNVSAGLLIWATYVWANFLLLDWILLFIGSKEHPVIQRFHNPLGNILAFLVFLSWGTVIGAIVSGWLGLIPAMILRFLIVLFAKSQR